jgi:hypothetical protein
MIGQLAALRGKGILTEETLAAKQMERLDPIRSCVPDGDGYTVP